MQETKYLRHIPTGDKYATNRFFEERADFEPWDAPEVVDTEARVNPDTVVPITSKTPKVKKAGLAPPPGDEALSIDASRRLP